MVQRLGIAQVLLHEPAIYILDEPMSGLDPIGRALVKEIIRELKAAGKCVFFSTHITSDVEAVCDRVGVILNGRLQAVEKVGDIMASGITGYQIRHRYPGEEALHETNISKEGLQEFLANLHKRGGEIILLEPQRKSLEDFFLEIVRQGK
jgi:ABC-2 type transport system ATP-binding protein